MRANGLVGGHYVEPYAGGAGVACELLISGVASHVHLNDASPEVHAFWWSILNHTEEFCRRIRLASLTIKEWRRQREVLRHPDDHDRLGLGFALFFLNRCNRSGIPSGGVIGGLNQTGRWKIDARFPKIELITRIEAIASRRRRVTIENKDAEKFLWENASNLPPNTLVYCDPPYFRKSDRLYLNRYEPRDHAQIARVMQSQVQHPWLVSYDAAPEVMKYYVKRRSFTYGLQYYAGQTRHGNEVFFCSDNLTLPLRSKVKSIDAGLVAMSA